MRGYPRLKRLSCTEFDFQKKLLWFSLLRANTGLDLTTSRYVAFLAA
jgi:hypothetical protein